MLQVVNFKRLKTAVANSKCVKMLQVLLFPAVEKSLGLAAVSLLERGDGAHPGWSSGKLVSLNRFFCATHPKETNKVQ